MNKTITILGVLVSVLCTIGSAQTILYQESFTGGRMQLSWGAGFSGDTMKVANVPGNPSGDGWVGFVGNRWSPGRVGLSFAGTSALSSYSVEAQIFAPVQAAAGGTNSGIVAYYDTAGGANRFFSLLTDFDSDQRIRLRKHFTATDIRILKDYRQTAGEIPGGIPSASRWVKLKLTLADGKVWAHYNDVLLAGSPFPDTAGTPFTRGFFGVYAFNMADSTIRTLCDDIIVTKIVTSVYEDYSSIVPSQFTLNQNYPNPFNPQTTIEFALPQSGYVRLDVFNALGVRAQTLVDGYRNAGTYAIKFEPHGLPSGVYFYRLSTGNAVQTKTMTLLK